MSVSSVVEGVYVHLPFCDGKCLYCAFYSVPGASTATIDDYLEALDGELAMHARTWSCLAPRTLFMGGGTPTLLTSRQLERLCRRLAQRLDLSRLEEWTVEANPGTLDDERLAVLKSAGVSRISLGVQSLDDIVLARLGRRHTSAQARDACALVRAAGFKQWSLDLIACVPGVTARQWTETVRAAVALEPPHVSVYALTSEEGSRLAGQVKAGTLALLDDRAQLDRLHAAERFLREAGLRRYEISNYARPGFECRHNLSCWRGETYLGIGCAAASHVDHARWTNAPNLDDYLRACRRGELPPREYERLSPRTEAVDRLVFGLRMAEGVALGPALAEAGAADDALARQWRATLARLRREGLVRMCGGRCRLTARGRDLADHVAVELMP